MQHPRIQKSLPPYKMRIYPHEVEQGAIQTQPGIWNSKHLQKLDKDELRFHLSIKSNPNHGQYKTVKPFYVRSFNSSHRTKCRKRIEMYQGAMSEPG